MVTHPIEAKGAALALSTPHRLAGSGPRLHDRTRGLGDDRGCSRDDRVADSEREVGRVRKVRPLTTDRGVRPLPEGDARLPRHTVELTIFPYPSPESIGPEA